MLALQGPPNTVLYLVAGYVIIGGIGLIYIVSLVVRQRNLKRDVEALDAITREDDA
jgi:hypothetical protein